jgi:peptidyl-prolyl cis-trans isomerase D
MLRGIQKATANWFGRVITGVILGLIAISFAVWGIGDIFRGFGQSQLAKIGNTEISIEQFRQTYTERLQQISRQAARPISTEQAIAFGLPRQMLGQMLAEAALDEDARNLGLAIPDSEIAKRIMSDPNFAGANGQFDNFRFQQLIRQAGFTEPRYVAEQRRVSLRRQIAESIGGGVAVPKTEIDLQNRYENEQRNVEFVRLDPAQAGDIPEPSPEAVTQYYNERKALFRAPEFRKLLLVVLSPAEEAQWAEISDADLRKAYEDRRARYVTPEKRDVQQIVFPNAEEARAAREKILAGTPFAQIAAERGLKDTDVNLGSVNKASILDRAVADAAFALPPEGVSEPVTGRFGTVLVRVGKIEAEIARPFEEVAAEIRRELSQDRARSKVTDLRHQLDDERGAGQPLAEIAQKLNVKTRTIEAVDRSGRNPQGEPAAGLPQSRELLTGAFSSDVGVENDAIQMPSGDYVWYEVEGVTPSRERPLDEVRERVIARMRDEEIARRLKAKAEEIAGKVKAGTPFAEAAPGLQLLTVTGLKRAEAKGGLSYKLLASIFELPKDGVGSGEGDEPTQWFVFRVTDITVPTLDATSPEAKQSADTIRNAMLDDLIAQYVARLQTDFGASVNERALNQVLTGGTTN